MKSIFKALLCLMLLVMMASVTGCHKDPEDENGNNQGGGQEPGLYLGVIGFNDQLKTKPIGLLNTSTEQSFVDFIDALTTRDGTALYHAVYTALDWLQSATLPEDLINVSVVTFTDGLDNASMMLNDQFNSQTEFLNAINNRIKTDKVGELNINAYAVGMRGNDVQDVAGFQRNLQQLSSSPSNVFEVENMDSVSVMFSQIATQLYNQTTVFLGTGVKIPGGYDNNTMIRITFDNVENVNTSNKYIEGVYSRENGRGKLSNVNYCGLQSTSGAVVFSDRQDGAYYWFTFADLKTLAGVPVTNTSNMKLWRYVANTAEWQPESEFTPSSYSEIQSDRKSAIIVLVLDCTTSLGSSDFYKMKNSANGFVELLNHYGNSGGGDGNLPSVITSDPSMVTANSVCCGGTVLNDGGSVITRQGVCWSLHQYPTLEDNYVFEENPSGNQFTLLLSGLESGKTYYYKAFAINGIGVGYGEQKSFTTTAGGGISSLPYIQDFSNEFGTYTTYSVAGPQVWSIEYGTAKMSGYEHSTNYANEDWLISSPVAITGVDKAKVAVTYCLQYVNSNPNDVTLQISTDYVYGDDPARATWRQMPETFPNTSSWSDFKTLESSLNDYIGQTITVAIRYTSSESQSRTIEIKSIAVQEGQAGGGVVPPSPGAGQGSGTADDPYNVEAGIALQGQEIIGWVQGYIVGTVKSGTSTVSSNEDIKWSAPFDSYTNVVIADNPTCHDISLCLIVNLPNGTPLRTQVNLVDHPENLGKTLAVLGKLRFYFGQAGLRDSGGTESDYVLEGAVTPPNPGNTIFSENFANGQGQFTIQDIVLPEELTYIWAYASNYSCMKASAFINGANYNSESWLVSPSIVLPTNVTSTLSFSHAMNYGTSDEICVMISTNYYGDVTTASWQKLNVTIWPEGNNWVFVASTANLTAYAGQTVNIAFKYVSTTDVNPTWEVKDIMIRTY